MTTVIFLGPSLPVEEARTILDAIYLPPAKVSDIVSVVGTYHPACIGLIDGEFGQSLSVWHTEILYALEAGVACYGASSMGALRAAETEAFGMIGVGEVFRLYASGEINDDDEVALAHGLEETGYCNLSDPMVNLRFTFRHACQSGVIDQGTCDQLTAIAKGLFFPERSLTLVYELAARAGVPPQVVARCREFTAAHYVNIKRLDAKALLETLRDLPRPIAKQAPRFTLSRTTFFRALYERDRTVRHDGVDVPLSSIAAYAALHHPDFNRLNTDALNRALVGVLTQVLEIRVSDTDIDDEVIRFRRSHDLATPDQLAEWQSRVDLTAEEFREMMAEAARARRLQRWLVTRRMAEGTVKLVLDELRCRGEYEEMAREAANQERIVATYHPHFAHTSFGDLPLQDLVRDHVRATPCRMDTVFYRWAEEAGFARNEELQVELLRARLAREVLNDIAREAASALTTQDPER